MTNIRKSSFIRGTWQDGSGETFPNFNPYSPSVPLEFFESASTNHVADAVNAAHSAFFSWRKTPAPQRGDYLNRIAERILARADSIGRDMALEEGKTLLEGIAEAQNAAAQFRFAASMTMQPSGLVVSARDPRTRLLYSIREPVGVVVAITPWNFPISIPAWKISHALAEGNTVIWKPAEITPRTSVHLAEIIREIELPPGVFNMVMGPGKSVGVQLLEDSRVNAVSFTGSNSVGCQIAQQVAGRSMKVQLELGGSNPAVVMPDADLTRAALEIANGAFLSSGQKCTATARVIAHQSIVDDLTDAIVDIVKKWRTGDPFAPDTKIGPVASAAQFQHVTNVIQQIPRDSLLCGTIEQNPQINGFLIEPHVALDRKRLFGNLRTEIFGPITLIQSVNSIDAAIAEANASPFGLSASIFTADLELAARFTDECEAGVVKVNKATTGNEIHVPFGGHKESGSGSSEMGWASREFFTKWKTVYLDS